MTTVEVHETTAMAGLARLSNESVDCVLTSPPYWRLRDYGEYPERLGDTQSVIGWESTPEEYAASLTAVFEEVKRVLKPTGVLWLNLDDSYVTRERRAGNLQIKSLAGIPWRVALKLMESGWILRADLIWEKTNAMPQSAKGRPVRSHEYVFLFTKSPNYNFDDEAFKETAAMTVRGASASFKRDRGKRITLAPNKSSQHRPDREDRRYEGEYRRGRSVISVAVATARNLSHPAPMPLLLAKRLLTPCCQPGGVVLDPFAGSGTTGVAALQSGCSFIGFEPNGEFARIARERLQKTQPALPLFS